ncbi:hypothetical protein MPER_11700, partial [Moniliophthora perniciosa FA553]
MLNIGDHEAGPPDASRTPSLKVDEGARSSQPQELNLLDAASGTAVYTHLVTAHDESLLDGCAGAVVTLKGKPCLGSLLAVWKVIRRRDTVGLKRYTQFFADRYKAGCLRLAELGDE